MSIITATPSLTKLYWNTGSAFNEVPGVQSITLPGATRKLVDVTSMDSVNFTDTRPANLASLGEMSVTLFYNQSNPTHMALAQRTTTGSNIDTWQLQYSTGNTATMSGSVTNLSFKMDNPADGILMGDMKIGLTTTFILA